MLRLLRVPAGNKRSRSVELLPLACALATVDSATMAVPLMTWSTSVVPFQMGFGYGWSLLNLSFAPEISLSNQIEAVEEWTRTVERGHTPSIDIAARRLVSAVGRRTDKSDALIDAVMVWENLLGTSTEVTFRISAALAKLLEKDPTKRKQIRRELASIYDIRSRLVHGAAVDPPDIDAACTRAINVAAKALRISYYRGTEWLSLKSNERCDTILLEWP